MQIRQLLLIIKNTIFNQHTPSTVNRLANAV